VCQLSEFGLSMEVVPRDAIGRWIYLYGIWEMPGTRFLQAVLRPGMTFLDVGANIGYYSVVAARLVGSSGEVHAFEPVGELRARLNRNARLNGLTNVTPHAEAVAQTSGQVVFYRSTLEANQGLSTMRLDDQLRRPEKRIPVVEEVVPALALDDFVASLPARRADLMKIDVEGAELDVIAGAASLLSGEQAPAVLFESFDIEPMAQRLADHGYTVRRLHYTPRGGLEFPEIGSSRDRWLTAQINELGESYTTDYVAVKGQEFFGAK
jgi:FkbM family methyltransferase